MDLQLRELVVVRASNQIGDECMLDAETPRESNALATSQQAAEDPVLTPCKCPKPAIQTMDYPKMILDEPGRTERRINRVCSRCWSHWFGPPNAVKLFTKREWDAWIEQPTSAAEQS